MRSMTNNSWDSVGLWTTLGIAFIAVLVLL
jgi:hypothetical protein